MECLVRQLGERWNGAYAYRWIWYYGAALRRAAVFVLLDEAGGEICKSDGTVADEAEKAVHCTGIYTGCTVSSGLFCPLYQGSGKIMYSIHNLNFNILNTYKTTLSMK